MYQPRKSILQMFDPLMTNSPSTPKREESNASPDSSDKENDVPRDPLSLSQYFNRTYHVKSLQQPLTPKGKLIDFGDASIDEGDELVSPMSSPAAAGTPPDGGNVLLPAHLPNDSLGEGDAMNATSLHVHGPFVTPQNRKILGEIDVDALQPPKPPTKQGALKISFLTVPDSGSSPAETSTVNVASLDTENATSGPVITLYPPTFDSLPPTSSAPQISDKVDDYLSPQLPLPHTVVTSTPRRSPLSSDHTPHRASMDLQSSFQLQLQNGEYSFNLVNDKISFLESSQELSFPESGDDSDVDEIVEDVSVDDMLKSLTLQDKAVVAAKQIFSPTSEKLAIAPIPESDAESASSRPETPRAVTPVLVSSPQATMTAAVTSNVIQKPARFICRPSVAPRPSISGLKPTATTSKPPARVFVPPTKPLSSTASTQRVSMIRPPGRQSSTVNALPKTTAVMTRSVRKPTEGPRRVLVQAGDKSAALPAPALAMPPPKTQGPQRVLVRATSTTTNPVKRPLGPSPSINPPAPTSRPPGPSRIAVPSNSKAAVKTSSVSKPVGRWV